MFLRRAFTSILLPIVILGCASQAQHLRSQPVLYMDITGDSNRMVEVLLPPIEDSIVRPATPVSTTPVASNDRHTVVTVASLDLEKIPAGVSAIAATPTTTIRT